MGTERAEREQLGPVIVHFSWDPVPGGESKVWLQVVTIRNVSHVFSVKQLSQVSELLQQVQVTWLGTTYFLLRLSVQLVVCRFLE